MNFKQKSIAIMCIVCFFLPSVLHGCLYNVRDVGFVDLVSSPYHVYFFIQNDHSIKYGNTLKQISDDVFTDSNVEIEIINIGQTQEHPAIEYLKFWEIDSLPAAILVAPDGRSLVMPVAGEDIITASVHLEKAISSPVRTEILRSIVEAHSVILLIEGNNADANKKIYEAVQKTAKSISEILPQLPKRIEKPPHIITIHREWLVQEKILLWSLDILEHEANEPIVAVLYGKGRYLGPPFKGNRITETSILDMLLLISSSCECGLDKQSLLGASIPLKWDKTIQSRVIRSLGFDAENPMVKIEVGKIMSSDPSLTEEKKENIPANTNGYNEESLASERLLSPNRISPSQFHILSSRDSVSQETNYETRNIENLKNNAAIPLSENAITKNQSNQTGSTETVANAQKSESQPIIVTDTTKNLKTSLYIIGVVMVIVAAGGISIFLQSRGE